LAIQPL